MHFIVFEAAGEVVDCVVALRLVEPLLTVEGVAIAPPRDRGERASRAEGLTGPLPLG